MGITREQHRAAMAIQHVAAHDVAQRVRLVAGPGTGKSSTIEERVAWLLRSGTDPETIWAVSFTRVSARDLKERVHAHCAGQALDGATAVRITTLHSLALHTL